MRQGICQRPVERQGQAAAAEAEAETEVSTHAWGQAVRAAYALAGAVLVMSAAACGSSAPPAAPKASKPPAVATTTTCGDLDADLITAISDLKAENKADQEAWVMGGDGSALQALISDTNGPNANTPLGNAAAGFNLDANAYLNTNSPYLAPGWQTQYNQVNRDIYALAADCGVPH
jgi:hypothetical protein